jgi:glycosyltransferase involved in cell wall biosynthesis
MSDVFESLPRATQSELDGLMWAASRFVLVNSWAVGQAAVGDRGLPADKLVVVPNGLPPAPVTPLRADDGTLRLGALGRLSHRKGVHDLLAAVRLLIERATPVTLVVAGEGPELDSLKTRAQMLGVADEVEFVGFIPDERLDDWFADLDVFVLPSLTEGLPFTVLEAMRAGRPVVATRVGGVPEVVVDGVTGLLAEPANERSLADSIGQLAADPDLRRRMADAARMRFLDNYTLEVMHRAVRSAFLQGGLAEGCAAVE